VPSRSLKRAYQVQTQQRHAHGNDHANVNHLKQTSRTLSGKMNVTTVINVQILDDASKFV
jgi:hypothetical protein